MPNRDNTGTASRPQAHTDPLEAKVREAIAKVPKEAAFTESYGDSAARKAFHGRALIAAVLDALFDHSFDRHSAGPDGSLEVEVDVNDPFSALASVRRDFLHDRQRLDNGFDAQLVLKPASRESVEVAPQIPAQRKALLLGILLISLWCKNEDAQSFKSKKAVRDFVARMLDRTEEAIKTQSSQFANNDRNHRFKKEEIDFYRELENQCQATNGRVSPFGQLLPAFTALCKQAYPRTASASSVG